MANSVDPDQMPHSMAFDLGLYCLQRPICPTTKGYYGILFAQEIFSLTISVKWANTTGKYLPA